MRLRSRLAGVRLVVRTVLDVLAAWWTLVREGFPARRYRLQRVEEGQQPPPQAMRLRARTVRIAVRVLRLPAVGSTCLPTSPAVLEVLRRRSLPADLVIGVAGKDGEFTAPAWVKVYGHRLDASGLPPDVSREIARFRRSEMCVMP